jgi:hypothetical protein
MILIEKIYLGKITIQVHTKKKLYQLELNDKLTGPALMRYKESHKHIFESLEKLGLKKGQF